MAKRYEELSIEDDFMFGKVMEDKELCRDVLQCLLEEPVGELEEVRTQREFRYTSKGKPIRLDVYTRDQKRIYDAEMQRLNHQTPENLELPRRSRFYQSTMDTDHLGSPIGNCRRARCCFSVPSIRLDWDMQSIRFRIFVWKTGNCV